MAGYDYFGKLIYEIYEKDKMVSIQSVAELLRGQFESVNDAIIGGSTDICAHSKKQESKED
jgi:hypothetical protein